MNNTTLSERGVSLIYNMPLSDSAKTSLLILRHYNLPKETITDNDITLLASQEPIRLVLRLLGPIIRA